MKYNIPIKREKEFNISFSKLKDDVVEDLKDFDNNPNPNEEDILYEFTMNSEFYLDRILEDNDIIYLDDWINEVIDDFKEYLYGA